MRRLTLATLVVLITASLPGAARARPNGAPAAGTGPVLAAGVVTTPDGPAASGSVTAYAWPDQLAVEEGDDFALIPMGHTAIGPDGRYTLRTRPTAELVKAATSNGGYLNVSVVTKADGFVHDIGLSRFLGSPALFSGAASWPTRPGEDQPALDITIPAGAPAGPSKPFMVCFERRKLIDTSIAETVVGEFHTEADTIPGESYFHYGESADSDVSVAIGYPGEGWSLSGTAHVGNGGSGMIGKEDPRPKFNAQILTDFEYGIYSAYNSCDGSPYETVRVREWVGGSDEQFYPQSGCRPGARWTTTFKPGHFLTRNENRAARFSDAVEVFGAGLGSQSGYSRFVEAHWKFGDAYEAHLLCGSDDNVLESTRVFAGPVVDQPECLPGKPC